jgi:hypothetical protein
MRNSPMPGPSGFATCIRRPVVTVLHGALGVPLQVSVTVALIGGWNCAPTHQSSRNAAVIIA